LASFLIKTVESKIFIMIFRHLLVFFFVGFCFQAKAQSDSLFIQKGIASYYGGKFHGRKTASGEIYHKDSLTAAHKILPFGTVVKVINLKRNTSVIVRVTDRLPMSSKRQIDLSLAAASELGMLRDGVGNVRIEAIDLDQLDQLVDYFADREHPGLRIRRYYRGIPTPRREMDLKLKPLETPQLPSITFL
jgi:rare lipoprotein A